MKECVDEFREYVSGKENEKTKASQGCICSITVSSTECESGFRVVKLYSLSS